MTDHDVSASEESSAEEELTSFDLPAGEPHPSETVEIPLADIAELENSRPAYYGIEDLKKNLHTQGQLEPCLVRPAPKGAEHGRPYELVFGYRRKRAAEELEWPVLRCEVRKDITSDTELLERQISENFQRENLSPVAEANAMQRMKAIGKMSNADIARRLGCDPSHVSHRLSLLALKEDILTKVDVGQISASAAETIASLPSPQAQSKLAKLTERNAWDVKKVQKWARDYKAGHNEEMELKIAEDVRQANPLALVQVEDVQPLPSLQPREDLGDLDYARLVLYQQLRLCNDQEMLFYLEEEMGYPYERLWEYVEALDATKVEELSHRLAVRFLASPHRYRTFEPSLRESLCQPEEQVENWEEDQNGE
jgi:ParB family chromosome partitioning protein